MNIRTMYRIAQTIMNSLGEIIEENVKDGEVLELLLDSKRLTELLLQELNNSIKLYIEKEEGGKKQ